MWQCSQSGQTSVDDEQRKKKGDFSQLFIIKYLAYIYTLLGENLMLLDTDEKNLPLA